MKFNVKELNYLYGNEFSSGLSVKISTKEKSLPLRMEYIEDLIRNKNVIHLGCADHIPLIKQKIQKNKWFHKRIVECTNTCLGIDISREGIDYLKNELDYSDVLCYDILADDIPQEVKKQHWDFIVLGEVLEHTNNPVAFLKSINERYTPFIDGMIISVPNAFRYRNFKYVLKHIEFINSDHRYWYTPYTLAKIAIEAGMTVENFQFCLIDKIPPYLILKKLLFKMYPAFRDVLVMILKFSEDRR